MSRGDDNPVRQFVAAWQAAATVASEWAEQTAAVTTESFRKLTADPAVRALVESLRNASAWVIRECECPCADAHPDDMGVCDKRAVITRHLPQDTEGLIEARLCAPCAVAQGVAEMRP